jgi:hypothetical protein
VIAREVCESLNRVVIDCIGSRETKRSNDFAQFQFQNENDASVTDFLFLLVGTLDYWLLAFGMNHLQPHRLISCFIARQ